MDLNVNVLIGVLGGSLLVLVVFITLCFFYMFNLMRHSRAPQRNECLNPMIIIRNPQNREGVSLFTHNTSQIIPNKIPCSSNTSTNANQDPDFSNSEIPSPEFRVFPPVLVKHDQHSTQDSRPPVLTPKMILPSCSGAKTGRNNRDRFKHEDPYDYPPSPRRIKSAVADSGQGVSQTLHEADTASFKDPAESVAENQVILNDPEDSSGGEGSHAQAPESCVPELNSEGKSEKDCPLTKEGSEAEDRPLGCKTMKGRPVFASPIFTTAISEMKMLKLFQQRNQWKDPTELNDTTGTSELSLDEQEQEQEEASPNSITRKSQESSAQLEDIANMEKISSLIKNVIGENSPEVLERREYTDSNDRKEEEDEIEGEEQVEEVVE
ncbi:uncharacterized protein LOC125035427 [Penaeus chinensis]|uniref:uncharacterized protein LOC125035427 n=1 Tax=Penaeus chinensis TaxID=139456 RepID=UPI001FB5774E|nr:uncharacterized protein LOC125035427 [Penaeus chinensis]